MPTRLDLSETEQDILAALPTNRRGNGMTLLQTGFAIKYPGNVDDVERLLFRMLRQGLVVRRTRGWVRTVRGSQVLRGLGVRGF